MKLSNITGRGMQWGAMAGAAGLLLVACGDSDGGVGSTASGGSAGTGAATSGGTSGSATGGTGNASTGGTGNASTGGSGNAGSGGGGNAGSGGTGNAGSGGTGNAGSGGTGNAGSGGNGGSGAVTSNECFADIQDGLIVWDYDVQGITTGSHCKGTNQQDIKGIQRIVYLGDSIMNGTPPTPQAQMVRNRLDPLLKARFPGATSKSCAVNGARNDDLMKSQIPNCFGDAATRNVKTLTLVISGGNDIAAIAGDKPPLAEAKAEASGYVAEFRQAIEYLKDSTNFPAGNDVVFSNVYEYTDTSANLSSCALANLVGLSGTWLNGAAVLVGMNEQYAKISVDTGSDMVFMMEDFCGHGYKRDDASLQCYRGPGTPLWFDLTCIHPNPEGHGALADMFMKVITE